MVADRTRRRSDPAREVEAGHAGAGADAALGDVGAESLERPRRRRPRHGARIRHLAVVALADDRDNDLAGPLPGGQDGRLEDRADGVRAAQVHRGLDRSALVDLELGGQLAGAVDRRYARGRRQRGGATTVTPVRSPLAGLRVTDQDARDVGDRVAGTGLHQPDGAGHLAPAPAADRPLASLATVADGAVKTAEKPGWQGATSVVGSAQCASGDLGRSRTTRGRKSRRSKYAQVPHRRYGGSSRRVRLPMSGRRSPLAPDKTTFDGEHQSQATPGRPSRTAVCSRRPPRCCNRQTPGTPTSPTVEPVPGDAGRRAASTTTSRFTPSAVPVCNNAPHRHDSGGYEGVR